MICILCIRHSSIVKPFIIIHPNFNSPSGVSETGIQKRKAFRIIRQEYEGWWWWWWQQWWRQNDDDDENDDEYKCLRDFISVHRAVFTWLSKGIDFGFGFGFGFTTPFGWLVYLLSFWFYDSQVKTALSYPCYSYQGSTVMYLLIESTEAHLGWLSPIKSCFG